MKDSIKECIKNIFKYIKNNIILFILIIVFIVSFFTNTNKDLTKILGLSVIFIWLAQKYIEQFFNKDLEKFKSDLQKETLKFKIKNEGLQREMLEVIKEVYKKIFYTFESLESYLSFAEMNGDLPKKEKEKIYIENSNKLYDYFGENKIFFDEELEKNIENLIKKMKKIRINFSVEINIRNPGKPDVNKWMDLYEEIKNDVSKIKSTIENKFREKIGIIEK